MRHVAILTLLLCPAVGAADRPNIVFILADDMGYPDLKCYGHRFHDTPVLDQLARDGMLFTDFYAATPVCSSTRSTIMTGQYSARTAITDFIPGHWRPFEKLIVPEIEHQLRPEVKTPGDALRAAGYATGYIGKWHLGGPNNLPQHHGFDVVDGGPSFRKSWGRKPQGPKKIDFITEAALNFIDANKDRPFFITVSHHAVHIPVEGNPASVAKYEAKQKPDDGVNHSVYAAMTEDLDASCGRILKKLDELSLTDNTVVVFTSDNGGLRQIYTKVGEIISTNAPLRDEKGTLYEGGIRVPMIVRWPGVVMPNTRSADPTTTADLLPTFCEIASTECPDQPIDGMSMVSLLKSDGTATLDREGIYFHYPHYHHSRPAGAVRAGDWKLIEFFEDGSLELYNLKNDLSETTNMVSANESVAKHLQAKLKAWRTHAGARMPTRNPDYDPKKAHEWWSRRTGKPLDVEAMRKRYESKRRAN